MRCPRNEDGEKSKVYVEKWKNIRRRNSIAAKNYFPRNESPRTMISLSKIGAYES